MLFLGNRGESHFFLISPAPILYFMRLGHISTYPENREERRKFLCVNGSSIPGILGGKRCVWSALRFVSQQELSLSFLPLLFLKKLKVVSSPNFEFVSAVQKRGGNGPVVQNWSGRQFAISKRKRKKLKKGGLGSRQSNFTKKRVDAYAQNEI